MSIEENSLITIQKKQVFSMNPVVGLKGACSIGSGLMFLSKEDKAAAVHAFEYLLEDVSYFIPASGSGSRMFKSLHDFIETDEQSSDSSKFFKELKNLALYGKLPLTTREKLEKIDLIALSHYFIHSDGLNLSETPKGLIAFHHVDNGVLNPFQEHSLQAAKLFPNGVKMHFTIDEKAEADIRFSINHLGDNALKKLELSFSFQDESTHAYCFDENQSPISIDGELLRRPAGHGALLKNLNSLNANIILIKNIDNVQHINRAEASNNISKQLIGTLKLFQDALRKLNEEFNIPELMQLNAKYQWLSDKVVLSMNKERFKELSNRPIRVCGMVKNEGEPGGGPFWVSNSDGVSKQIVEKIQISEDENQLDIMSRSSHFNPVLIALSKFDIYGNELDLEKFSNPDKYLKVKKTYKGQTIYYRELPGLWNGGMHHWNTLFIEVPSNVFSPVKSVLDLLSPLHKA